MSPILDETLLRPSAEADPFAYGERTVLQMRSQPFQVQDELGTVVTMPIDTNQRLPSAVPLQTVAVAPDDPIARLEQKLDLALRQIDKLQQRIESIDLTLVRVLSR